MNILSCTNSINSNIQREAIDHFSNLNEEFHRYFSCVELDTPVMALTRNPFRVSVEDLSNEHNEEKEQGIQEEFLDMIHDSTAEDYFEDESLEKFWEKTEKACPKVSKKPLTLLTVFPIYMSL